MNGLSALEVKELNKKSLMQLPGVVGIGVSKGSGERLNVYVREMSPEILEQIPETIGGLPVNIIAIGEIRALQFVSEEMPKAYLAEREVKMRPAVPGVSIGI